MTKRSEAMSAAADAEDKTEKAIGDARARWRRRASSTAPCCSSAAWREEALAAFEATLEKEPNRLGATIGAAKAAEKLGDAAKARQYSAQGRCACRECRPGQARNRRGPKVDGQQIGCVRRGERCIRRQMFAFLLSARSYLAVRRSFAAAGRTPATAPRPV